MFVNPIPACLDECLVYVAHMAQTRAETTEYTEAWKCPTLKMTGLSEGESLVVHQKETEMSMIEMEEFEKVRKMSP